MLFVSALYVESTYSGPNDRYIKVLLYFEPLLSFHISVLLPKPLDENSVQ